MVSNAFVVPRLQPCPLQVELQQFGHTSRAASSKESRNQRRCCVFHLERVFSWEWSQRCCRSATGIAALAACQAAGFFGLFHGCVNVYRCMYICTYTSIYMCIYVCAYIYIYVHIYVYIYIYIYVCMNTCKHTCIYTSVVQLPGKVRLASVRRICEAVSFGRRRQARLAVQRSASRSLSAQRAKGTPSSGWLLRNLI